MVKKCNKARQARQGTSKGTPHTGGQADRQGYGTKMRENSDLTPAGSWLHIGHPLWREGRIEVKLN